MKNSNKVKSILIKNDNIYNYNNNLYKSPSSNSSYNNSIDNSNKLNKTFIKTHPSNINKSNISEFNVFSTVNNLNSTFICNDTNDNKIKQKNQVNIKNHPLNTKLYLKLSNKFDNMLKFNKQDVVLTGSKRFTGKKGDHYLNQKKKNKSLIKNILKENEEYNISILRSNSNNKLNAVSNIHEDDNKLNTKKDEVDNEYKKNNNKINYNYKLKNIELTPIPSSSVSNYKVDKKSLINIKQAERTAVYIRRMEYSCKNDKNKNKAKVHNKNNENSNYLDKVILIQRTYRIYKIKIYTIVYLQAYIRGFLFRHKFKFKNNILSALSILSFTTKNIYQKLFINNVKNVCRCNEKENCDSKYINNKSLYNYNNELIFEYLNSKNLKKEFRRKLYSSKLINANKLSYNYNNIRHSKSTNNLISNNILIFNNNKVLTLKELKNHKKLDRTKETITSLIQIKSLDNTENIKLIESPCLLKKRNSNYDIYNINNSNYNKKQIDYTNELKNYNTELVLNKLNNNLSISTIDNIYDNDIDINNDDKTIYIDIVKPKLVNSLKCVTNNNFTGNNNELNLNKIIKHYDNNCNVKLNNLNLSKESDKLVDSAKTYTNKINNCSQNITNNNIITGFIDNYKIAYKEISLSIYQKNILYLVKTLFSILNRIHINSKKFCFKRLKNIKCISLTDTFFIIKSLYKSNIYTSSNIVVQSCTNEYISNKILIAKDLCLFKSISFSINSILKTNNIMISDYYKNNNLCTFNSTKILNFEINHFFLNIKNKILPLENYCIYTINYNCNFSLFNNINYKTTYGNLYKNTINSITKNTIEKTFSFNIIKEYKICKYIVENVLNISTNKNNNCLINNKCSDKNSNQILIKGKYNTELLIDYKVNSINIKEYIINCFKAIFIKYKYFKKWIYYKNKFYLFDVLSNKINNYYKRKLFYSIVKYSLQFVINNLCQNKKAIIQTLIKTIFNKNNKFIIYCKFNKWNNITNRKIKKLLTYKYIITNLANITLNNSVKCYIKKLFLLLLILKNRHNLANSLKTLNKHHFSICYNSRTSIEGIIKLERDIIKNSFEILCLKSCSYISILNKIVYFTVKNQLTKKNKKTLNKISINKFSIFIDNSNINKHFILKVETICLFTTDSYIKNNNKLEPKSKVLNSLSIINRQISFDINRHTNKLQKDVYNYNIKFIKVYNSFKIFLLKSKYKTLFNKIKQISKLNLFYILLNKKYKIKVLACFFNYLKTKYFIIIVKKCIKRYNIVNYLNIPFRIYKLLQLKNIITYFIYTRFKNNLLSNTKKIPNNLNNVKIKHNNLYYQKYFLLFLIYKIKHNIFLRKILNMFLLYLKNLYSLDKINNKHIYNLNKYTKNFKVICDFNAYSYNASYFFNECNVNLTEQSSSINIYRKCKISKYSLSKTTVNKINNKNAFIKYFNRKFTNNNKQLIYANIMCNVLNKQNNNIELLNLFIKRIRLKAKYSLVVQFINMLNKFILKYYYELLKKNNKNLNNNLKLKDGIYKTFKKLFFINIKTILKKLKKLLNYTYLLRLAKFYNKQILHNIFHNIIKDWLFITKKKKIQKNSILMIYNNFSNYYINTFNYLFSINCNKSFSGIIYRKFNTINNNLINNPKTISYNSKLKSYKYSCNFNKNYYIKNKSKICNKVKNNLIIKPDTSINIEKVYMPVKINKIKTNKADY